MTTRFEARDPLFEQRVRESFRMQPLMAFIGAEPRALRNTAAVP